MITLAAEFPNDNPRLHQGARWMPSSTTGPAVAKLPSSPAATVLAAPPEAADPVAPASWLEVEVPPPRESAVVPSASASAREEAPATLAELAAAVFEGEGADEEPVVVEELEPLEAEVSLEGALVAEAPLPAVVAEEPSAVTGGAFSVFAATLVDVALAAGSPAAAAAVPALLEGRVPAALADEARTLLVAGGVLTEDAVSGAFVARCAAWRAILLGTSDDFGPCGASMLDEFAADLLARAMGALGQTPSLKRELRTRGVAAFGLVDVAA